jgi:hypothetical protein
VGLFSDLVAWLESELDEEEPTPTRSISLGA